MGDQEPDLFQYAYVHEFERKLEELSALAEPEEWGEKAEGANYDLPVLRSYVFRTFSRIVEEDKIAYTETSEFSCFNTGLATAGQESIYGLFRKNQHADSDRPYFFLAFHRSGEHALTKFHELPAMAQYFGDPSCLVFDTRLELRVNIEHIIGDNRDRFPDAVSAMNDYALRNLVTGAIDSAKKRVARNYKAAVPQYYQNKVQLLLPLCLVDPAVADVALVVDRCGDLYRGSTCLTLDMAYNNARQLARPDRDWLRP
jgi:hypothetical protein